MEGGGDTQTQHLITGFLIRGNSTFLKEIVNAANSRLFHGHENTEIINTKLHCTFDADQAYQLDPDPGSLRNKLEFIPEFDLDLDLKMATVEENFICVHAKRENFKILCPSQIC